MKGIKVRLSLKKLMSLSAVIVVVTTFPFILLDALFSEEIEFK